VYTCSSSITFISEMYWKIIMKRFHSNQIDTRKNESVSKMSHWKDEYIICWLECIKLQQSIWLNEQSSRKRCSKTQVDSNNLWCSQTLETNFIQILSQNNFKVPITLCALSRLKKHIDRIQSPIQVIKKNKAV